MRQFRAVFWLSDDSQAEVRLTGPESAGLPEAELIAQARTEAAHVGLDLFTGGLVVGLWQE
jgi:hypothetical protein